MLSRKVNECKPLIRGRRRGRDPSMFVAAAAAAPW